MMKRFKAFWSLALSLALLSTTLVPITTFAAPASPNVKAPFLFAAGGKSPAMQTAQFVPGQIIVKYKSQAPLQAAQPAVKLRKLKDLGTTGAQLLSVPSDKMAEAITSLRASGQVEYATPDYILHIAGGASSDTLYSREWGLDNTGQLIPDLVSGTLIAGQPGVDINVEGTGKNRLPKQPVLVGLIDTGVDINHPDLQNSIWNNPRVGQYGYDGDYHGWNFVDNNGEVFDSANSIFDAHGTHVAGIIAAKARNRAGVTGAAPNVKIVVLKFIGPDGYGLLSNAIAAIDYASKVGVKVINASWGGLFPLSSDDPAYDPSLQPLGDAIQASGILFVAASGNTYDGPADNLDTLPGQGYQFYPAGFRLPNVVTVAAVNSRGNLCTLDTDGFSANFGVNTVDIAAPGSDIVSTFTMDPSWGGSVEADIANTHTACWGFGIQDIDGRSNRAQLLQRELLFLKQKHHLNGRSNSPSVLLVDDDNSGAGYPECNKYWTRALDDLHVRYKTMVAPASVSTACYGPASVSTACYGPASVSTACYGPSLTDMAAFDVVIWQTGRDGESNPVLTAQDENNLTAYVQQGGSLLLSGERAIDEDPAWSAQLLQVVAFQLGTPLPFYNYFGRPGTNYDGFSCVADGADFGALPVSYDLLVPANPDTARGGLTPRYAFDNGTSMSAAYVSAVGALLYGKYPRISAEAARLAIMASAKPLDDLAGKVGTGGMVDARAALNSVAF